MVKHKINKQNRFISKELFKDEPGRYADVPVVQRIYFFKDKRKRDTDNLDIGTKAYIDGMADAGCFKNDYQVSFLPTLKVYKKTVDSYMRIYLFDGFPENKILEIKDE